MDRLDANPELLVTIIRHILFGLLPEEKGRTGCAALGRVTMGLLLVWALVVLVATGHARRSFRPNLDRCAGEQGA